MKCGDIVVICELRVLGPEQGPTFLLEQLHEEHVGMTKVKALGRSYIWWPNMDSEIENCVKKYSTRHINSKKPCNAPLHSWDWPRRPWSRDYM